MTAEEFLMNNMWNKCISFSHIESEDIIYMIYDNQHMRKLKLHSLDNNVNVKFIRTNESKLLFINHCVNNVMFVENTEIWIILERYYNLNYKEIDKLIKDTLLTDDKTKISMRLTMNKELFSLITDDKFIQL
ncbi:hypothetical protein M0Q50_02430 [bacterium]|jgi:hypothetical protein|nr:hypothetical protein [bacterium]